MASPPRRDIVELTIDHIGVRGDGVASFEGEAVYIPFTAPGDRARVELGARRGEGRSGTLIDLTAPVDRAPPACPPFGVCGGCALQHLMPEVYDGAKLQLLRLALSQHGFNDVEIAPLRRLAAGTRRRARLSLSRPKKAKAPAVIGFNGRASHDIVDMRACAVLHPDLAALVAPLRHILPALLEPGGAGAATVTLSDTGIDLLLDLPDIPDLAGLEALAAFAEARDLARLAWRAAGTGEPVPAAVRRIPTVAFAGAPVALPHDAFLQASAEADRVLTEAVLAGLDRPRRILDLFAGLGTFTFALAHRGTVLAVEQSKTALTALDTAAKRAGLHDRIGVLRRDLDQRPLQGDELAGVDALVFDPPRAGAMAQSRAMAASTIPTILAVSCNPATFARDARILVDGGYRLVDLRPVDSFVWSPHLELVARFER
jgi:23S rRNA (uracil1939-C5)-methyltransferase